MDNSSNTGGSHNFTPVNQAKLSKKKKKPLVYVLAILLVMILGVGVGLFLVNRPSVFQPRANWEGSGLYFTNCYPHDDWRNSNDPKGQNYRCFPDNLDINFFKAIRGEGILRGFLNYPRPNGDECFIRHYRCQKRDGESNADFIDRIRNHGCQQPGDQPGYRIYVGTKNPSAPYNTNFREVIESDRKDQQLLAEARFTPNYCGAQQMDLGCGKDLIFNSVIDLRPETCREQQPTKTPTPTPTKPVNCPTPPAVNGVVITCPNCK